MKIDKKRGRELLKKLDAINKLQRNLRWDFFGIKFMRLQRRWNEIEHELYKVCFGNYR